MAPKHVIDLPAGIDPCTEVPFKVETRLYACNQNARVSNLMSFEQIPWNDAAWRGSPHKMRRIGFQLISLTK